MKAFELWRQSQLPERLGLLEKVFATVRWHACALDLASLVWRLRALNLHLLSTWLSCRDFRFSKARSLMQRVHLPIFSVIFSNLGILVFSRAVYRNPTICGKEMECFYTITGVKEGPDWEVQFQDWRQNGDGGRFVATTNNCIWH